MFSGVQWTPSLIAFLYYYFVVITYWLPGADIAMVLAVACLVFQISELRIGRVLMVFGLFCAWAWVCYLASARQTLALEQTWNLTKLWMVAFVAYNVLRTRQQIRFFLAFSLGCVMLFPYRGAMVNYLTGNTLLGRALWNYSYNNPNDLAAFSVLAMSAALCLLALNRNRLIRMLSAVSSILLLLLIFFTQSRGTLVAVIAVGAVVGVSRLRNPRVLAAIALSATVVLYFAPEGVWNRLRGLSNVSVEGGMQGVDEEGSAAQRFQLMQIAAKVASDHLVTGVGAGVYPEVHAEYARSLSGEFPTAGGKRDAHNTFLSIAAELGSIGLIIFLVQSIGVIIWLIRMSAQTGQPDAVRVLAFGLIAFLLSGLFGSFGYLNVLHLHMVVAESLVLATAVGAFRGSSRSKRRRIKSPHP